MVGRDLRQRDPLLLDERRRMVTKQHPVLETSAPAVAPGHQCVARRHAAVRWRMRVGEADARAGEPLHLRCRQLLGVRVARSVLEGAGVAHPHVVREKDDDVWRGPARTSAGARSRSRRPRRSSPEHRRPRTPRRAPGCIPRPSSKGAMSCPFLARATHRQEEGSRSCQPSVDRRPMRYCATALLRYCATTQRPSRSGGRPPRRSPGC